MIYLTADLHLGHENIITYCNRPFKNINHMNKVLVSNWNNLVKEEDVVYVIGDFSKSDTKIDNSHFVAKMLSKLNGTKHLILGNHDGLRPFTYVSIGFTTVHTALNLNVTQRGEFKETNWILHHDPCAAITKRDTQWICGHLHDLILSCKNVVNVGVDVWDYKPVSMDRLKAFILEKEAEVKRKSNVEDLDSFFEDLPSMEEMETSD